MSDYYGPAVVCEECKELSLVFFFYLIVVGLLVRCWGVYLLNSSENGLKFNL